MRIAIIVSMLVVATAIAQEQRQEPPDVKLLTPDECAKSLSDLRAISLSKVR
jgi:hypothetical protein